MRQNAEQHAKYIQTLIQHHCVEKKNLIYFIRYEDLVSNKEQELTNLFRFMLDAESLEGTNIQRRIKQVVKIGEEAALMYKLKATTLKFNSNRSAYTDSQVEYIKQTNRDFLFRFGYVEHP